MNDEYSLNTYVVAINGPPGAGKDTLAAFDYTPFVNVPVMHVAFSTTIYIDAANDLAEKLQITHEEALKLLITFKDRPIFELGTTGRELLIAQNHKPGQAPPYFATKTWYNLADPFSKANPDGCLIIVSDLGMQKEWNFLRFVVSDNQLALVHLCRPGRTFANDSRSWVTPDEYHAHEALISNTGDVRGLYGQLIAAVHNFWPNLRPITSIYDDRLYSVSE